MRGACTTESQYESRAFVSRKITKSTNPPVVRTVRLVTETRTVSQLLAPSAHVRRRNKKHNDARALRLV